MNFIDTIVIDNTTYSWPDFVLPISRLLTHDFTAAEINGTEVIKGDLKYKYPINEVKIHKSEEVLKSLLVQALLPADLGYLALAYDDMFNLPSETTVLESFKNITGVKDPIERKKLLADLVMEAKRDKSLIDEYKRWSKEVAKELRALNYNKYIYHRGRRIFFKTICNNLALQLENIDVNMNYYTILSRSRIKLNGSIMQYFTIATYLACISKSLLLLQHNQGDVNFPVNYLYIMKLLSLVPTKLLFYNSRPLDPPFEVYTYLF